MRVPDVVPNAVAFLMYQRKGSQELSYGGTCFIVQYALATTGRAVQYLVTARHVIAYIQENSSDGIVHIRSNLRNGDIIMVHSRCSQWLGNPIDSSADVAVCAWQPSTMIEGEAKRLDMDLVPIGVDLFATPEKLTEHDIGLGDDVFCTGLFSRFVGKERNLPIVRRGSIALMPRERVPSRKFGAMEAILIEVRSIGGLSGSPVFVMNTSPRLAKGEMRGQGFFFLLGLLHGHWDSGDSKIKVDVPFEEERLNLGIALVVPAQKILEALDRPSLKKIRAEIEQTGGSRSVPD